MIENEFEFRQGMCLELLHQLERAAGGSPELLAQVSSLALVAGNKAAAAGACPPDEWTEALETLGAAIVESLGRWRNQTIDEVLEHMAEWIADKTALEDEADDEREERIRDEADMKAFELSVGRDLIQLPVVPE